MGGLQLPLQSGCSCSHPERTLMLGMWGNVPVRCTAPILPYPSAEAPWGLEAPQPPMPGMHCAIAWEQSTLRLRAAL